jgi:hypothetical protein
MLGCTGEDEVEGVSAAPASAGGLLKALAKIPRRSVSRSEVAQSGRVTTPVPWLKLVLTFVPIPSVPVASPHDLAKDDDDDGRAWHVNL